MDILRIGSQGDDVKTVQRKLKNHGYYLCGDCKIDGDYGPLTASAVQEFQGGHIDEHGWPLETDGVVGASTWWAFDHPSGEPQRSHIDPLVPSGLTPQRQQFLDFSCDLYRENIREIPNGSNGGDGVDKITNGWAVAWCALYVSYVLKQSLGLETFGTRQAAVINIYRKAKELGMFHSKANYDPKPGDIFIMLYQDSNGNLTGKGHTGVVLRVSEDGELFNSQEGNAGNRLATKIRKKSQSTLVGFVNFYTDANEEYATGWESGVISAAQASSDYGSTR